MNALAQADHWLRAEFFTGEDQALGHLLEYSAALLSQDDSWGPNSSNARVRHQSMASDFSEVATRKNSRNKQPRGNHQSDQNPHRL